MHKNIEKLQNGSAKWQLSEILQEHTTLLFFLPSKRSPLQAERLVPQPLWLEGGLQLAPSASFSRERGEKGSLRDSLGLKESSSSRLGVGSGLNTESGCLLLLLLQSSSSWAPKDSGNRENIWCEGGDWQAWRKAVLGELEKFSQVSGGDCPIDQGPEDELAVRGLVGGELANGQKPFSVGEAGGRSVNAARSPMPAHPVWDVQGRGDFCACLTASLLGSQFLSTHQFLLKIM